MPEFFSFTQGTETNPRFLRSTDASPLLGRFRAVPQPAYQHHHYRASNGGGGGGAVGGGRRNSLLTAGWRGSVHVGYGALLSRELEDEQREEDEEEEEDEDGDGGAANDNNTTRKGFGFVLRRFVRRRLRRWRDLWVSPKAGTVKRAVDSWWSRWALMVVLPAMLVRLRRMGQAGIPAVAGLPALPVPVHDHMDMYILYLPLCVGSGG